MKLVFGKTIGFSLAAVITVVLVGSCELLQDAVSDPSFTPGNSASDAAQIDRDTSYTVTLESANDNHWFKFDTDPEYDGAWDRVEVRVSDVGGSGVRISLLVQDSEGENRINSTAPNDGANITRDYATPGGTYYVRVTNYWQSGTGPYTLTVRNLDMVDEYEPNDTFETAYDLGTLPATDINATIVTMSYNYVNGEYSGDFDWYKFETISENDLVVSFTNVSDTLRVGFRLYDDNRSPITDPFQYYNLGQSVQITFDDGIPPAGTVMYLKVFGSIQSSTHATPSRGDYTLSITQEE